MAASLTIKPARSFFDARKKLRLRLENKFAEIGIYEKQILFNGVNGKLQLKLGTNLQQTQHKIISTAINDTIDPITNASDKYYNVDAMAMLTDYMGKAVEQVKDIVTLQKFQELQKTAVLQTTFNCILCTKIPHTSDIFRFFGFRRATQ